MNVLIVNKYKDSLSDLNIDIIKKLDGEFDVDTITDTFSNFYFNRMILDITALKDHFNLATIQKLSASLDSSKIIIFLDDDPRINNSYLSKVISLGIYNFTRELSGINYLMENPNSYRDVAQYHDLALEDEAKLKTAKSSPFPIAGKSNSSKQNSSFQEVGMGTNYAYPESEFKETSQFFSGTYVLGFKDLSDDAGATTLIYMLKKQLAKRMKVLAVELNNNDFSYFKDSELLSTNMNQFSNIKNSFPNFDVVLIDLNNAGADVEIICSDIIFLLEPSTIKLNSLIRKDRQALTKLKDRKIVLNKSLLSVNDVKEFEYEAGVKLFYNIPPLDERKDSQMLLDSFLAKLGLYDSAMTNTPTQGGNLFSNIFRRN